MKNFFSAIIICALIFGCKSKENIFTVTGNITNANGKQIYLEEVPIGTMRPTIVDSAQLQADGSFTLTTKAMESSIYNVRVNENMYPIASVINDVPQVKLNVNMSEANNQFSDKYDVQQSPASQSMKDFMATFNSRLQKIFTKAHQLDSLRNNGAADSILAPVMQANTADAASLKKYTLDAINKSGNAALTMFQLGYYQSTANNPGFGIEPLSNEQVNTIIDDVIKKNPEHNGLIALRKDLQSQMDNAGKGQLVGKPAPDFTLPDVNGKPVALSSFKGKYVLVDFWASWCKPCRQENPNVVAAYNKYKNKNFTILGVSLDQKKDAWLNAIQKDGLTWQHVSDLKYWEAAVVGLYGIEGIPFNVLIDPDGKILAQSLTGAALEASLAKYLQ